MSYTGQPTTGEWRQGLFECCESCSDCMLAYCCPGCYAFCVSQKAGQNIFCNVLQCIFYPTLLCCLRQDARESRGIEGGCFGDVVSSCCCPCCTVIQIGREFD